MTKRLVLFFLLVALFLLTPKEAQAKRLLPRFNTTTVSKTSSGLVGISVKFRSDRRAIVVNFSNLSAASLVTYSLTYESNGLPLGAGGGINTSLEPAVTRELLFGSCSKGVCRYDTGISNAKFVVTSTIGGRKRVKTFRLKV